MGLSASSTSWRSPGAILDAQPAQAAYEVSRTSVWVCLAIAVLRRVRRGLRFDELDEGLGERRAAPVAVGDQIERAPDAQILHPETEEEPRTALVLHRPLRDERDSDACAHALLDRLSRAHLADDTERRQPARLTCVPGTGRAPAAPHAGARAGGARNRAGAGPRASARRRGRGGRGAGRRARPRGRGRARRRSAASERGRRPRERSSPARPPSRTPRGGAGP